MDVRFVAVAVAVVLVGAVAAAVLGPVGNQRAVVAAGMPGGFALEPWDEGEPEVRIFLCKEGSLSPACGASHDPAEWAHLPEPPPSMASGKEITWEQRESLVRGIGARPEVEKVFLYDKQAAYEQFRRDYSEDTKLLETVTVDHMTESFQVKLRAGADWLAMGEALISMPGVAHVSNLRCFEEQYNLVTYLMPKKYWPVCSIPVRS